MQPVLDFKELQTPPGHGDVLVAPEPRQLPDLAEENRRYLDDHAFRVLDVSSRDCRRIARQKFHADSPDSLWIVTGHQPEFIHPGVWAKHVVTQRLAERVAGVAANIIVDHDAVKEAALVVPAERDPSPASGHCRWRRVHVPFAACRSGMPWEALGPLSTEQLADFRRRVKEAYGARYAGSLMEAYFNAAGVAAPEDFVEQTVMGRRAIDAMHGVRLVRSRARDVWGGPLLAQMLVDAERFAACYNEALREYRRQLRVKGNLHPIPDLVRRADRLELPVWAVRPGMPRQRMFVSRQGDRMDLYAENDLVGSMSVSALRRWRTAEGEMKAGLSAGVRPRALTLTIWARLFLSDVFIHGIGGAKYDRITDLFIRRYFGIEPPGICCVSATLRLDLPSHAVDHEDLREARRRLREVRHKPQEYLSQDGRLAPLVDEKRGLVERSEWLRRHERDGHLARRDVFLRIHDVNERMLALAPALPERLASEGDRVARELAENAVTRSREYFIGLFRPEDLRFLADNLPKF